MCIRDSISDGSVIKNTKFYEGLIGGTLNIPPPGPVQGSTMDIPYVFIGDEAFAFRSDFMKPYSQQTLNVERQIFNYQLSRARRVVENAFGILSNRFRIFQSNIYLDLHRIDRVVLCCCILHNFLRRNCTRYFTEEEDAEEEPSFERVLTLLEQIPHNATPQAKLVREMFVDYFISNYRLGFPTHGGAE